MTRHSAKAVVFWTLTACPQGDARSWSGVRGSRMV